MLIYEKAVIVPVHVPYPVVGMKPPFIVTPPRLVGCYYIFIVNFLIFQQFFELAQLPPHAFPGLPARPPQNLSGREQNVPPFQEY
jgi:hypothetical protein